MRVTAEEGRILIDFDSDSEDCFGFRLTLIRTVKGVSQKELAEKIGVRSATISAYESGKATPSIDTAIKIAKLLNTSLDFLCGIDIKMEV